MSGRVKDVPAGAASAAAGGAASGAAGDAAAGATGGATASAADADAGAPAATPTAPTTASAPGRKAGAPVPGTGAGAPGAYERLTPLMCLRLAAPHTWPGPSVLPTAFGGLYALVCGWAFSPLVWCLLLAVAVLAQSAVNTLNDWADFKKGTDTAENSDDPTDAVLVFNNPDPRHVLALACAEMGVALVCGLACCALAATAVPIVIGAVGALVIVAYSNGKLPISYLPLGELVSGVVMGFLIPLADVVVFACLDTPAPAPFAFPAQISLFTPSPNASFPPFVCCALPFVAGIALVMATQNACDIERDAPAGRKTLAVLLGRVRARMVYRLVAGAWVVLVLGLSLCCFGGGLWLVAVVLVLGAGTLRSVLANPLVHETRGPAMAAIGKANLFVNGAYLLGMMYTLMNPAAALL